MHDLFFYEAFEEESALLRTYLPAGLKAGFTGHTIQESGHTTPPAPFVSIRTQSVIPPAWGPTLNALLTRSTGYDHVTDFQRRTGHPLACGYLPTYCARAVAEQAALLWMALLRKLPRQTRHFTAFDRDGLTGGEAAGRRLLVVGVGNIGHEVVRIGHGLDMKVAGVDIVRRHTDVTYVDTETGLRDADVIVCAMSLTPSSSGYFNYERMRDAKPGAIFVNVARGEMSPSSDLLRLVDEGRLGGVGLDVFSHEAELAVSLRAGRSSDDPEVRALLDLTKKRGVIVTPHNAFNTAEAIERKARQSVEQINAFMDRGAFLWPVP